MSTITSPATQAQGASSGTQYSFRIQEDLQLALMDSLDVTPRMGAAIDVTGMGALTMRLPFGNVMGMSRAMSASGGETTLNAASSFDIGYSAVSVGQYDLSYTQSAQNRVIGLPGATVNLETLAALVPANFVATIRSLYCAAGGAISYATVGSTSLELNADDLFNISYKARLRLNSSDLGIPCVTITPKSYNSGIASLRSEPGFQFNLAALLGAARYTGMQRMADPFGLGYDVQITTDVGASGGADLGFCVSDGAIARVKASPSRIMLPNAVEPMYLDEFGLVVYKLVQALNSATFGIQVLGFLGATLKDPLVGIQILVNTKTPS
jgi:hypothetical protein